MDDSDIPTFAELAADPEIAPLLEFEPVVRKVKRPDGWTPELQRELIARIAATGTVQAAVWQMGKHATGAEALYKTPSAYEFRASWDAAVIIGRRRNQLDSQPPFLGEVPGITRRKSSPSLFGGGGPAQLVEGPDADSAPSDDEKLDLIRHIAAKFMRKVAAEREARLAGEIVAADFYLRQITMIEVTLDLMSAGFGRDAQAVLRELRRGEHGLLDIAATGFSDLLDASRRLWWAEEGEQARPPWPDTRFLQRHASAEGDYATNTDQHATGALTTPARGYSQEQWAAMDTMEQRLARDVQFEEDATAQKEWESRAHAEHNERTRSDK